MMPPLQSSPAFSPSPLKPLVLVLALALAVYITGPPIYRHLAQDAAASTQSGSCTPCNCECSPQSDSLLLPGVGDTQSADCENVDPDLNDDLDKNTLDLLSEELKLQETVAEDGQLHSDSALLDAKKMASQYQKEAEKCNSGMETCEEAREKSQAALVAQKKLSAMWEMRARDLGWRDKSERSSIFSRIGLPDLSNDAQADSLFRRRKGKL